MYRIYLVPHSHYDAVWAFTKEDYLYITIEEILKEAVKMMAKPEYRFLIEQIALIEEIERRNPKLFETIKTLIKAGRIEIAGGEYLMSDTMLSGGETLVRQILIGKTYAREKLGIDIEVMWGADSFGFNAQMPQIYRQAGYRFFAFRRGCPQQKPTEFWWQGLDGSRILTHWMPLGYRAGLDLGDLDTSFEQLKSVAASDEILMPSGSGSIPPQPETFSAVRSWNRRHKDAHMTIARSLDFFENLEKKADNFDVVSGEMYSGKYSRVFPDCASSRIWLKQQLRHFEHLLLTCEKWSAVAWLLGVPYPADELRDNWKKVLWGAFHDVVPGTAMDEAYEEIKDNYSYLEAHLAHVLSDFRSRIEGLLINDDDIIVFNPLSWPVKNWVEVDLGFPPGRVRRIAGVRNGKEEIPVEVLDSIRYPDDSYNSVKLGFIASVPALGFSTYKLLNRRSEKTQQPPIRIKGTTFKNQFFKVDIEPATGLVDIYMGDKHIVRGNEIILEEEIGDLYYHRQNLKEPVHTESGKGVSFGKFKIKNFKVEKSPLRRIIHIESDYYSLIWPYRLQNKLRTQLWRHNYLSLTKQIIIYNDIPRVDFVTVVNNRHPQIKLRLKFATDVKSDTCTAETAFGSIERKANSPVETGTEDWIEQPTGIFPAQNWVNYSDSDMGVTLINQGLPEHEIRDNALYLTLLRSVLMLSSDGITGPAIPTPDAQEHKTYTFRYSLLPHIGEWQKTASHRQAYEFNCGLLAFQLEIPKERRRIFAQKLSFMEVAPSNVVLSALKKGEKGDSVIARFYETEGKATRATISLMPMLCTGGELVARIPLNMKRVDLLERETGDVDYSDGKITLDFKPFEIVNLKIEY
jgi:alpha-mannosidase